MNFLRLRLGELAADLGFAKVGVCSAAPSQTWAAYREWLAQGFAGEMEYLHQHAALRADPRALLPGVRSVIAVSLNYYQHVAPTHGNTRVARYAAGRDYHKTLRRKLKKLASQLAAETGEIFEFRVCVDSAPVLEREYAHRAGLGWYGKNTMLIDSKRGSWFFIGLILTTLEFEPDEPSIGGCGTCRACIEACPTGAIVEVDDRWQVDARSCISYLTIEKPELADERIGDWTFGCDICQEVCPFNQPRSNQPLRAQQTVEPDFLRKGGLVDIPLSQILTLSRDEWDRATQGSPIRRAGFDGVRRVAEINQSI